MICPRCEALIRHGDRVKALVHAVFERVSPDAHTLYGYFEEWIEHIDCKAPSTWSKIMLWFRRNFFRA